MSATSGLLWQAAAIDWSLQWAVFLVSYAFATEKVYDLTGSSTFILLTGFSLYLSYQDNQSPNIRQLAVALMVLVWALRLGSYLVHRVLFVGGDKRFDRVKTKFGVFWFYWTIQGFWVYICLLPILLLYVNNGGSEQLTVLDYTGWALYILGFTIEAVADHQKYVFKSKPANKEKWIATGLWAYSRHPNYLGELILWFGVYVSCLSGLTPFQAAVATLSPIWVVYHMRFLAMRMLEVPYDKKYADNKEYQAYKKRVKIFVPFVDI